MCDVCWCVLMFVHMYCQLLSVEFRSGQCQAEFQPVRESIEAMREGMKKDRFSSVCHEWFVAKEHDSPRIPHMTPMRCKVKNIQKHAKTSEIHPSIYLSINKEPNQQILQHRLQPVSNMFLFVSLTPGTWDLLWRAAGGHQPVARAPSTAGLRHFVNLRHMTVILWLHIVSICFDRLWRTHCFKELKMASSWCSELGECAVAVGAPGQDRNHLYPDD